jgi:hypothetical protein
VLIQLANQRPKRTIYQIHRVFAQVDAKNVGRDPSNARRGVDRCAQLSEVLVWSGCAGSPV